MEIPEFGACDSFVAKTEANAFLHEAHEVVLKGAKARKGTALLNSLNSVFSNGIQRQRAEGTITQKKYIFHKN